MLVSFNSIPIVDNVSTCPAEDPMLGEIDSKASGTVKATVISGNPMSSTVWISKNKESLNAIEVSLTTISVSLFDIIVWA